VQKKSVEELMKIARKVRRDIVTMTHDAMSGHPGGSLSETEFLVALYFNKLRVDPKKPDWPDRDRFILSKGHACPALYSVLAELGFFPKKELKGFRKINSLLQGHADKKIPGVEMSAGSLGQGISFGIGVAFAGKLDKRDYNVYVLIGDGELQEGQIWEAAMTASHHKLDNLVVILDKNKLQNDYFVDKTKHIDPIEEKWKSFGWHVIRVDGHDFNQILKALDDVEKIKGKPKIIIADTVKGKGVSFMENNPDFHGKAPDDEEYEKALKELGE